MDAIGMTEAGRRFSELMRRVADGRERVIIARHGKPMMALISLEDLARLLTQNQTTEESRAAARAVLAEASRFRKRLLAACGGQPLPESADIIAEMRGERLTAILGGAEFIDRG
jgi:prevent-host-death family protein